MKNFLILIKTMKIKITTKIQHYLNYLNDLSIEKDIHLKGIFS